MLKIKVILKKFKKYKSKSTNVVKDSKSMKQFQKELDEDLPLPKNFKPTKKKPEGKVVSITKKSMGGEVRGIGKAIRGFNFKGVR